MEWKVVQSLSIEPHLGGWVWVTWGCSQVVRHWNLTPRCVGSIPTILAKSVIGRKLKMLVSEAEENINMRRSYDVNHPDLVAIIRTGYPRYAIGTDVWECEGCGRTLNPYTDHVYSDEHHDVLCKDCLLYLHDTGV